MRHERWNGRGLRRWMAVLVGVVLAGTGTAVSAAEACVVRRAFVSDQTPFPSCHASTIAETPQGLVAAWFGGSGEGNADVGIWLAQYAANRWSEPREVATGVESAERRYPCWNPVLFQYPQGPLVLFYKVGPSPSSWWGLWIRSDDGGQTWSRPARLPDDIVGPVRNKPVALADGRLLCGASSEFLGWRVHLEWTDDRGTSWSRTDVLNDGRTVQAIQPTILQHADGRLQILCRNRQRARILTSWSSDGGRSWTPLAGTPLPNPNSGIDGLTLRDGRQLLVYNHTQRGRSPLNVALSDDGQAWQAVSVLEHEPGEYSYPAVIQDAQGLVHVTYTWNRRKIRHLVLDPAKFQPVAIENGNWPG